MTQMFTQIYLKLNTQPYFGVPPFAQEWALDTKMLTNHLDAPDLQCQSAHYKFLNIAILQKCEIAHKLNKKKLFLKSHSSPKQAYVS